MHRQRDRQEETERRRDREADREREETERDRERGETEGESKDPRTTRREWLTQREGGHVLLALMMRSPILAGFGFALKICE